jgi:hypothetical protein
MWYYVSDVIGYYISQVPNIVSALILAVLFTELVRIIIRGSWLL